MSDFRTDVLSCEGCPLASISFDDCRYANEGYGDCKEVIMWLDEHDKQVRADAEKEYMLNTYGLTIKIADYEKKKIKEEAIDEFVEAMRKYWGGLRAMDEIERVAEQLKESKE